jgi:hypothetical protein
LPGSLNGDFTEETLNAEPPSAANHKGIVCVRATYLH